MAKYTELAAMLESRIKRGDYLFRELPTEQRFADETESSRMTARRAMAVLIDKGVIERKPNGRRLRLNTGRSSSSARKVSVALLTPAFASSQYDKWLAAAKRVAVSCGISIQSVLYVHWNDAVIMQALKSFKGVLLVPHSEPIPQTLLNHFATAKNLIALDDDLTRIGVPSIGADAADSIMKMAGHLYELGHRRIDLLNTQPPRRTEDLVHWTQWKRTYKVEGNVVDEPVEPYGDSMDKAYTVVKRMLSDGQFKATALICVTDPTAAGAVRALYESGLVVGRDVSVCALEGNQVARHATPSRTSFEVVPVDPYLELCMRWLISGTGSWEGRLKIQPGELKIFQGESTRPAPSVPAQK